VFTRNYEALLAYNHTSAQALLVSLHHKQYPIWLLASSCLILTFVQCTGIRLATAYYGGRNLRHVGATWPLVVVWRSPAIGWPAFRLPTSATYLYYVCTHSFTVYILYTWVWAVSTCFYHTKNFNEDVDTWKIPFFFFFKRCNRHIKVGHWNNAELDYHEADTWEGCPSELCCISRN